MEVPRNFAKSAHKLIHALNAVISDLHNNFAPSEAGWNKVLELTKLAEGFHTRHDFEPLDLSTAEISAAIEIIGQAHKSGKKILKAQLAHLLTHAVHLLELYLKSAQDQQAQQKKNKAA